MIKKEREDKKTLKIITDIVGVLFTLWLMFMIIVITFFPNKTVQLLGFRTFLVADTRSMEPTLSHNDLIVIRRFNFNNLEVGQVISFWGTTPNNVPIIITHRIIRIIDDEEGRLLVTQGDANATEDRIKVSIDGANGTNEYMGKFLFKVSNFGRVINFLKTPQGIFVILINVGGLLYIGSLFKKKKPEEIGQDLDEQGQELDANKPNTNIDSEVDSQTEVDLLNRRASDEK